MDRDFHDARDDVRDAGKQKQRPRESLNSYERTRPSSAGAKAAAGER
jgi:hypothetical protein